MTEYFKKDGDNYVKVEDKLFTQADVDSDIIPKRLERERAKFSDYDAIKEKADKVDSITQDFTTKLTEKDTTVESLTKELTTAKLDTVKVKAIHEFKLPDDLAEFVTGADETEIRTRAEKLAKGVTGGTIIPDKKPKPEGEAKQTTAAAKSLFGPQSD